MKRGDPCVLLWKDPKLHIAEWPLPPTTDLWRTWRNRGWFLERTRDYVVIALSLAEDDGTFHDPLVVFNSLVLSLKPER